MKPLVLSLTLLTVSAPSLNQKLETIAAASGNTVGVSAVHLESGARVALRGSQRFSMASSYKFPIAVAVLREVDRGTLRLDQELTLTASDMRAFASPLADSLQKFPAKVRIDRAVEVMVAQSDNTACDALLRLVGGGAAVTKHLRAIGIEGIDVSRPEVQLAADLYGVILPPEAEWTRAKLEQAYAAAGPEQRQRAGVKFAADPRDTATPEAMTELLVLLASGKALSPASTRYLLGVMEGTTTGANRLRGLLPKGTKVAHKTGTMGMATNDAGIVTLPGGRGRIAVSVFVSGRAKGVAERERTIAEIARLIASELPPAPAKPGVK